MSTQAHHDDAATRRLPPEAVLDWPDDRRALISGLYDRYGSGKLFHLAYALCGDIEMAGSSVVQAFETAAAGPHFQDHGSKGSTYREAADLLHLDPRAAARMLRESHLVQANGLAATTGCGP